MFGSQAEVARAFQLDRAVVHHWVKTGYVPVRWAGEVERVTQGRISAVDIIHEASAKNPVRVKSRPDDAPFGIPEARVRSHVPSATVTGLVGRQKYLMEHVHPVAILGYVAVLEGYPASVREVRAIGRRAGLPAGSLRSMIKHAELDPGHRDDLDRLLDVLPLSTEMEALVRGSALATIDDLARLFGELEEIPAESVAFLGKRHVSSR